MSITGLFKYLDELKEVVNEHILNENDLQDESL